MNLKIAVPTDENGVLDGHFGHAKFFEVFEVVDNKIESQTKLTPPPHEPGVIPKWLVQNEITDVITSGIGQKATKILSHFNINVHKGANILEGKKLVEDLLSETLELTDENCNHHHDHGNNHEHGHNHNHHNKHDDKHLYKHGFKRVE